MTDTELLRVITVRPIGDIANILQAAHEMPEDKSLHERLRAGYEEYTGDRIDDELEREKSYEDEMALDGG